jgi:preprotein translocase subunit SecF
MNRKERREQVKKQLVSDTKIEQQNFIKSSRKGFFQTIYEDHYKKLIFIPFTILLVAVILIAMNVAQTGDFVNKGYSLSGGSSITVLADKVNVDVISSTLLIALPEAEINVRELSEAGQTRGFIVETDMTDNGEAILNELEKLSPGLKDSDKVSITTMGSSLGESFFLDAVYAIIIAFIFMSIVVFIIFRQASPSLAVILSAFSDIIVTVAAINILGIKLSTAGIAALLMLIGYSVDTDILLATRVIKEKKGLIMTRVYSALKTGLTMNATTLVIVLIGLFISQSAELTQIFTILLIGLIIDVINTWIQNVGILRLYLERKSRKNKHV